jgi:L,D-peptidoglycan transpeptidase YkuD (ErfK/YbiS/YcfS/YnhG family)
VRRTGCGTTGLLAVIALTGLVACSTGEAGPDASPVQPRDSSTLTGAPAPVTSPAPAGSTAPVTSIAPARSTSTSGPTPAPSARATPRRPGRSLPLTLPTASASQVITVVAPSTGSTEAALQAWRKVPDGWRPVGPRVAAWLGSDGLTRRPSESRSATPIGSFTLTQAFGRESDPGTALPYIRTTPDDWWISQPGPLYNTRQRCARTCDFNRGDPNEHLFAVTPEYDYAAVIDYNTRNAPGGVRPGAGSAFFLHVSAGRPTAGCVAVPRADLVRVLTWLRPDRHPRILIGTG